jgi:hypothetical protein
MNFDNIEGAPTPGFKPLALFASLLPRLPELRSRALALTTPNPEDDLPVRLAIVGFSFRAPTGDWSYSHFTHLQEYRERELGPDLSDFYGEETDTCIQFSCLAVGYVLGLRHRNGITDTDVFRAECLLPGFLFQRAGHLGPFAPSAA